MDITQQFKASVMTVRLQRKTELAAASAAKPKTTSAAMATKTTTTGPRDDFAKQAKDVCNKITTLRNVLIENRTAYMRIGQHLKSATHMTDAQRDLIDRESEKFVTFYTQHLAKMRTDWKAAKRKPQERQHIDAVLDLLVSYLHSVEQIYLDQKKYRVQHELETYKLLKLAANKKKIPARPATGKLGRRLTSQDEQESMEPSSNGLEDEAADNDWNNDSWGEWDDGDEEEADGHSAEKNIPQSATQHKARVRKRSKLNQSGLSDSSAKVALDDDIQKTAQQEADDEDPLSADDIQLFEEENVHIYNFLQGVSEEVDQIEKNVVDIAQLQDIFTEKLALQQHSIERIESAVIGSTENVKDANEQIRQATQRNAGLRVWSLFFLLVMSFSLLFLDWYYD
ncbi:syntaxin-18 [Drosophila bipectinata]|uniref:syntaxin-18 n=1 Tax=Drosophila bipectinata TaxID=42026 RepID=UPI001C8A8531|nr:syntaxin-18 [Drosophila bipectinata]